MTSLAMNNGYRFESMQSSGMRHLIKARLGETLTGRISRDGTAIEARERPAHAVPAKMAEAAKTAPADTGVPKCRRGRPRRGETRPSASVPPLARQCQQTLTQMRADLPAACDRGAKRNAQGYKVSWNGYKLHLDTVGCGVPVSALLSPAPIQGSRAAIPLSLRSAPRVTNLYDLMDAAYCSSELREFSREPGHAPLVDHNPRKGEKTGFAPAQAIRYNGRTAAGRSNARLKNEFGRNTVMVRGDALPNHRHWEFCKRLNLQP